MRHGGNFRPSELDLHLHPPLHLGDTRSVDHLEQAGWIGGSRQTRSRHHRDAQGSCPEHVVQVELNSSHAWTDTYHPVSPPDRHSVPDAPQALLNMPLPSTAACPSRHTAAGTETCSGRTLDALWTQLYGVYGTAPAFLASVTLSTCPVCDATVLGSREIYFFVFFEPDRQCYCLKQCIAGAPHDRRHESPNRHSQDCLSASVKSPPIFTPDKQFG